MGFVEAVLNNDVGLVRNLLTTNDQKMLVNSKDGNGTPVLMIAMKNGNKKLVQYLLMKGADINVKDSQGQSASTLAFEPRYKEYNNIFKFLQPDEMEVIAQQKDNESKIKTTLVEAVQNNNVVLVHDLLTTEDAKLIVNSKDINGTPILMIAMENKNIEMVQLLIDYGADLNVKNSQGQSAWTLAQTPLFQDQFKSLLNSAKLADIKV